MPRIRLTVPFGSSRAVTDGSRRNDRIAAMEVMGLLMSTPPPSRPANNAPGRPCSSGPSVQKARRTSVSATTDEIADPAHLSFALGGVLRLVVVVHCGADQGRSRPAGADRGREQGADEVGDGVVEVGERDDEV